jgi:hypothetical protein
VGCGERCVGVFGKTLIGSVNDALYKHQGARRWELPRLGLHGLRRTASLCVLGRYSSLTLH